MIESTEHLSKLTPVTPNVLLIAIVAAMVVFYLASIWESYPAHHLSQDNTGT